MTYIYTENAQVKRVFLNEFHKLNMCVTSTQRSLLCALLVTIQPRSTATLTSNSIELSIFELYVNGNLTIYIILGLASSAKNYVCEL